MSKPNPSDLRGAVVVTCDGVLVLITSEPGILGVTDKGVLQPLDPRRAIVLGRLNDFLASGRPFHLWARDRGYYRPVSPTAEAVFLAKAQEIGAV